MVTRASDLGRFSEGSRLTSRRRSPTEIADGKVRIPEPIAPSLTRIAALQGAGERRDQIVCVERHLSEWHPTCEVGLILTRGNHIVRYSVVDDFGFT
jgi:hypothetical protein